MNIRTLTIDRIGLSRRSWNALHRMKVYTVGDMFKFTEDRLYKVRNLGKKSIEEILQKIAEYKRMEEAKEAGKKEESDFSVFVRELEALLCRDSNPEDARINQKKKNAVYEMLGMAQFHEKILEYVRINDRELEKTELSNRAKNQLAKNGCFYLSEIIFKTRAQLQCFPAMGEATADNILSLIDSYIDENKERILSVCSGKEEDLWDEFSLRKMILDIYRGIGFKGLEREEILESIVLPKQMKKEGLASVIEKMLAEGELRRVDNLYYRVYEKFEEYLKCCAGIGERSRDFIRKRLHGITLESIAQEQGLTRERVRQVVKRDVERLRRCYHNESGVSWFEEDHFRYLYENYALDKKEAGAWLGMSSYLFNYFELMDIKRGRENIRKALQDGENLDAGIRQKIKGFLNRNKLYVDGIWVKKRRGDLEELAVRKFCSEDVSFEEFCRIYNRFLEEQGIAYDEDLYYTEMVCRTRKNRLSEARFLLWKQNEQIRHYDIDARDYTELLDILNLESYENIEFSTMKFIKLYPQIMKKYDIRDQYELHNLLRKLVPEGSYHDFCCGRMPNIKFGNFDRDSAILDLLLNNAPISQADLADLIHEEYGYDRATIMTNYLQLFAEYYHQGIYSINQKAISYQNKKILQSALSEDFYYIDEVRKLYQSLLPHADIEEINPYNLKTMGFSVLSRYVFRNHPSLEAYFEDLLTKEEITDIGIYKKRFAYIQIFSQKLMELKRNLRLIEIEPNRVIQFHCLEERGITRKSIENFCDKVYDFAKEEDYFSIQSLKSDGFTAEIFKHGFSDWFYANLLSFDPRFSFGTMFGNIILYKGSRNITIKSFGTKRIQAHQSIGAHELMQELKNRYGCKIADKLDIIYKVQKTEIYYHKGMDRFYANKQLYDLEEARKAKRERMNMPTGLRDSSA